MGDLFLGFSLSDKTNKRGVEIADALIISFYSRFSSENTALTIESIGLRSFGRLCKDGLMFLPEMFGRKVKDANYLSELREFFSISKHGLTLDEDRNEVYDILGNRVMFNKGIAIKKDLLFKDRINLAICVDGSDVAVKIDIVDMFTSFDKVRLNDLDSYYKIYYIDKENFDRMFNSKEENF